MNSKFLKSALCLTVLCALNENAVYSMNPIEHSDQYEGSKHDFQTAQINNINNTININNIEEQNEEQNNEYNNQEEMENDEEEQANNFINEENEEEEQADNFINEENEEEVKVEKQGSNEEVEEGENNYNNISNQNDAEEIEEEKSEHKDKKTGNKSGNNTISKKEILDNKSSDSDTNSIKISIKQNNKKPISNYNMNNKQKRTNNLNINSAQNNLEEEINVSNNMNINKQNKLLKENLKKEIGPGNYDAFKKLQKNSEEFINSFEGGKYDLDMENMSNTYNNIIEILDDDKAIEKRIDLQVSDMLNLKESADMFVSKNAYGNYDDYYKQEGVKDMYDKLFKPCDAILSNNAKIYKLKYQMQQNNESVNEYELEKSRLNTKLQNELSYKQTNEEKKLKSEKEREIKKIQAQIDTLMAQKEVIENKYDTEINKVKDKISSKYNKLIRNAKNNIKELKDKNKNISVKINSIRQENDKYQDNEMLRYLHKYVKFREGNDTKNSPLEKAYNYVELRHKLKLITRDSLKPRIKDLQNKLKEQSLKGDIQDDDKEYSTFQGGNNNMKNKLASKDFMLNKKTDKVKNIMKKEDSKKIKEETIEDEKDEGKGALMKKLNYTNKKIEEDKKEDSKEENNKKEENNIKNDNNNEQ